MVHLEVKNKPPALKGKQLTHRNIICVAFSYNEIEKELAIFETKQEWIDNTPAYIICFVTNIIYWDDNKED